MKADFFKEMKEFIINEHKDSKYFIQYIRYYETMLQNKDMFKSLLNDLKEWNLNISFEDDDYNYGSYSLYLWKEKDNDDLRPKEYAKHHYKIYLTKDERYWGYCECSPEDECYDTKHNCCGQVCDWVAPALIFDRIESKDASFKGYQRDIWNLEEKWNEYLENYNNKIKPERLQRFKVRKI